MGHGEIPGFMGGGRREIQDPLLIQASVYHRKMAEVALFRRQVVLGLGGVTTEAGLRRGKDNGGEVFLSTWQVTEGTPEFMRGVVEP
jgi:hypothetical protein